MYWIDTIVKPVNCQIDKLTFCYIIARTLNDLIYSIEMNLSLRIKDCPWV